MSSSSRYLERLGVYGFGPVEPLLLAALVSEDPILLIGKAGTEKTFLLNRISEAMGFEHRHYDARLLTFDDLIGFPHLAPDGKSVTFIPTPATLWGAESVLVDELSRCGPEIQSKFITLIHERKMQGIPLERLRIRWAAMNPPALTDGEEDDLYAGNLPLDEALADRFAFLIRVPDWRELSRDEQKRVVDPLGEGAESQDAGQLRAFVEEVKPLFARMLGSQDSQRVAYVRFVSTLLTDSGYRISPRRARLLVRNLTSVMAVVSTLKGTLTQEDQAQAYKLALTWSLPHRAWEGDVPQHIVDATHEEAFTLAFLHEDQSPWVTEFAYFADNPERVHLLMDDRVDPDTRSEGLIEMLTSNHLATVASFVLATYPLLEHVDFLNADAKRELAERAVGLLQFEGALTMNHQSDWEACVSYTDTHPDMDRDRTKRAHHLFRYVLMHLNTLPDPEALEQDLNQTFEAARGYVQNL